MFFINRGEAKLGKNYFELLCDTICENIGAQNFNVSKEDNKIKLSGGALSYEISYDIPNKKVDLLEECGDGENQKLVSSWYFDSENMPKKDIALITNDFIETMGAKEGKFKACKAKKKASGTNESNVTGLFFANRMANIFPELKAEIQAEKAICHDFRAANFAIKNILPKLKQLVAENKDKTKINKLAKLLSDLYQNGTLDTRSIITMGILNGISDDESAANNLKSILSPELQKAWEAALKYKGKKVKPEKIKNKQSLLSKALEAQRLQ